MPMSNPLIAIRCDRCWKESFFELEHAGFGLTEWSDAGAKESFEAEGWVFLGDGDTVCGDCARKRVGAMNAEVIRREGMLDE